MIEKNKPDIFIHISSSCLFYFHKRDHWEKWDDLGDIIRDRRDIGERLDDLWERRDLGE